MFLGKKNSKMVADMSYVSYYVISNLKTRFSHVLFLLGATYYVVLLVGAQYVCRMTWVFCKQCLLTSRRLIITAAYVLGNVVKSAILNNCRVYSYPWKKTFTCWAPSRVNALCTQVPMHQCENVLS